jgi:uncharacterized membrane protein YccC
MGAGLLQDSLRIQREQITWWPALRGSIVVGVLAAIMIGNGQPRGAIAIAIGALFAAVAEMGQPIGHRWRTMLWTTVWLMVVTLIGGAVSNIAWLVVVTTLPVALVGGFSSALGKRAGLIGVLSMVVFTVSAGTSQSLSVAVTSTLLIGLGGVIQTAIVVVPYLLRVPRDLLTAGDGWDLTHARNHLNPDDEFLRHAVRLGIALVIGTILSQALGFEHSYWIPMTIVWMSRPYPTETVNRVIARLIGTIAGVLFVTVMIDGLGLSGMGIVLPLLIGSLIALMFIWADYAIAVAGVTTVVIALFALTGDPMLETAGVRIAATCIAALLTLVAILIWRTPEHG